ncbi:MAG: methyl-accepting chemotaxis protein [Bosea sp. (in: a-proteobacteria)]
MFHKGFKARIGQRMALWGLVVGFLGILFATSEVINEMRLGDLSVELAKASTASVNFAAAEPAFSGTIATASKDSASQAKAEQALKALATASISDDITKIAAGTDRSVEARSALQMALVAHLESARGRIDYHLANAQRNKLLLAGLILFMLGQIIRLEYRWLVKPVMGMAQELQSGTDKHQGIRSAAIRRDEIGMLGRALTQHFLISKQREELDRLKVAQLSDTVASQNAFQAQVALFQQKAGAIVQALDTQASSMAQASSDLATLSTSVDSSAGEAAKSTQAASHNVDLVAASIADISSNVSTTAQEAQRTSGIAQSAKSVVAAATQDAGLLAEAVTAIEQVMALIEDVAEQTNLLALNATIEAARAGEYGRGFAVVAAEVKGLASRTANATGDVRTSLNAITSAAAHISQRVSALETSVDEVETAAGTIAALLQEQDTTSRNMTGSTAQAADIVRQVSQKVTRLAHMVVDARGAADVIALASADIDGQAAQLRQLVDHFSDQLGKQAA